MAPSFFVAIAIKVSLVINFPVKLRSMLPVTSTTYCKVALYLINFLIQSEEEVDTLGANDSQIGCIPLYDH